MTLDIRERKYRLIELIMGIEDQSTLDKIEAEFSKLDNEREGAEIPDVEEAIRPIRANVTLEEIEAEQNYQPISYEEFRKIAHQLEIEETTEELLEMLTK